MITTIKIWMICWFIINFEPLALFIEKMFIQAIDKTNNELLKKLLDALFNISGCLMCLSFWFVLLFTLNPIYAIGAGIIGQVYTKLIN